MAGITHVPHLFSMKHIFLEVNTASLSIQKEERKKNGCLCSSTLDPRPPSCRPSAPKILQEQIYEQSILLIQDYTHSRLKHTYSRYSKSYLERPSYGVQNKWKGFSSQ